MTIANNPSGPSGTEPRPSSLADALEHLEAGLLACFYYRTSVDFCEFSC
jgi:hypothetical protein